MGDKNPKKMKKKKKAVDSTAAAQPVIASEPFQMKKIKRDK